MVDIIDRLTENMEVYGSIKKPSMFAGESSTNCKECGDPLPQRRRDVGNMHFCVPCAEIEEAAAKHRR